MLEAAYVETVGESEIIPVFGVKITPQASPAHHTGL